MHILIQYNFYFFCIFTALTLRRTSFQTADSDSDSWIPSNIKQHQREKVNKVHIKMYLNLSDCRLQPSPPLWPVAPFIYPPFPRQYEPIISWLDLRARLFNCICVGLLPLRRAGRLYLCDFMQIKQVRCQNIAVWADLLLLRLGLLYLLLIIYLHLCVRFVLFCSQCK